MQIFQKWKLWHNGKQNLEFYLNCPLKRKTELYKTLLWNVRPLPHILMLNSPTQLWCHSSTVSERIWRHLVTLMSVQHQSDCSGFTLGVWFCHSDTHRRSLHHNPCQPLWLRPCRHHVKPVLFANLKRSQGSSLRLSDIDKIVDKSRDGSPKKSNFGHLLTLNF